MRSVHKLPIALLVTFALALAPSAAAQEPTNDPEADSPSGTIYEIPLDQGRSDAAPRGGGSGGSGSPEGGAPGGGSPIRSENNFGSSSTVPGAGAAGESPPAAGSDATASAKSNGSTRDRGRSGDERKRGTETRDDGLTSAQEQALRSGPIAQATPAGPSLTRALLLIALGVLVAGGLGAAAARQVARRR